MTDHDAEAVLGRIPGRLKDARQAKGLSLDAVAKLSGVSRSMVSQIERGDLLVARVNFAELEQFLAYVKAGSGSMNPGIRIYFGAYDNATSDKATVFLAPTMGVTPGVANDYSLEPLNKGITGFPPKNY